ALGRLDSMTQLLPDPSLFLYMYVRKEAVLSSQIEGTQSSLADLLLFEMEEAPGVPLDDVEEVSNHVAALNHGLSRFREAFPLSLRLIREIHGVLLSRGRGADKAPGEFRTSQNWIGGTRPGNAVYVPPPPEDVMACMGALEMFLHNDPEPTPPLLKAALAHVQFETIHPFLDGNGRVGRLLISLILVSEGVLREPMLYLSLYFKEHRSIYYDLLQAVRVEGEWEAWIAFFADAVRETANDAARAAHALMNMAKEHRDRIQSLGGSANSTLRVHDQLQRTPVATIAKIVKATGLVPNTVAACMRRLEGLGLVGEITGKKRRRVFAYRPYLDILNEGTAP
ncbi:Fic family protein, partial [Thermodesulfobacteriota bacterium]